MRPYEVYMHLDLLSAIPKSGIQRKKVMDFIRSLREFPGTPGNFTDKDSSLRERQIKVIGNYAVTYWLDAPVRSVMVVDISLADY